MEWFQRDFDCPEYFEIYSDKEAEAAREGPALAALLELDPGALVLDLPCGWGRLDPWLGERGLRVAGGDLSRRNLLRHLSEHPGHLARLDLRALPFRDACADGVLCAFTSWGYFATREENLRQISEFARVLRPGGVLLLDLAGREHLERAVAAVEYAWYLAGAPSFLERVRWDPLKERILTDRIYKGQRFRHDIWIPTHAQVLEALDRAGLSLDRAFGGLDGSPWRPGAERWIYRALKPGASPGGATGRRDRRRHR